MADQERRSKRSQQATLAATLVVLQRVGLSGLTIEGVAAQAGVGKQTIYRWWPSKGALAIDALLHAAEPEVGFPDTGDLRADLGTILEQLVALLSEPELGPHFVSCLVQAQQDEALAARFGERVFGPTRGAYRLHLRAAQRAGNLRLDVDPDDVLDGAFGAVWFRAMTRPETLRAGYGQQIAELVLRGSAPQAHPDANPDDPRPPG